MSKKAQKYIKGGFLNRNTPDARQTEHSLTEGKNGAEMMQLVLRTLLYGKYLA